MSENTNNEVTKVQPQMQLAVPEETIAALDRAASNGVLAQGVASQFKKMFLLGACMNELRQLLTPEVMRPIMALQNSPVGFMTDRLNGGYGVDEVRNAVIEAAMNGVSVCGNEFNILVGRFYCTKNGMKHKLHDIPGLYKNVTPGIPRMAGEGAVIRMHLEWTYNGKAQQKDLDFAIRVNKGMGADAIIGKATRKAYAWLYEEITGNSVPEGDASDVVVLDAAAVEESPLEKEPQTAQEVKQEPSSVTKSNGRYDELPM